MTLVRKKHVYVIQIQFKIFTADIVIHNIYTDELIWNKSESENVLPTISGR